MEAAAEYTVALAGNPNVGKSTVFNALTGLRQHTGNWPGKTVASATGSFNVSENVRVNLVDVPGTYSLNAHSPEEEVARDYICHGGGEGDAKKIPDAVIVVCDACALRRNFDFAAEIAETGRPYLLCVNLADEAEKRGIKVDTALLEKLTGAPVVSCAARDGVGLDELKSRLFELLTSKKDEKLTPPSPSELWERCVSVPCDSDRRDRLLDKILTGRITAIPISALLLALVFFLTLKGASPVSEGLSYILSFFQKWIRELLTAAKLPEVVRSAICDGVIAVMCQVTAVMLPPMAIFFPLFTFLEDLGYLPRVAYNYDRCFKGCCACGKQALTMMMGLGCNAAGVTGCRIIDSPRERLVAMLTNSFVPCNGRLAVISALVSVFAAMMGASASVLPALLMCCAIVLGIVLTLLVSKLLSATLLRGSPSSFTLELPPYRLPKIREVVVRSVFDRTVFILGRAVAVAAPAGLVIWFLGNAEVGGESLLSWISRFLDPIGRLAGMDGVMMCAFILALPAAEIILPLALMGYSGASLAVFNLDGIAELLRNAGWTPVTAVCAVIFTLVHFPCSTTIITVKRETGSNFYAAMSAVIPTAVGYLLCVAVNLIFSM